MGNIFLYNFSNAAKNIIKISGISVYPEDIETIVLQNKNISEAAVINFVEKNGLEKFVLCVVIKNKKYDKKKLYYYCQENLTSFQQPTRIFFLKSLPKTKLGKINKPKLKLNIKNQL